MKLQICVCISVFLLISSCASGPQMSPAQEKSIKVAKADPDPSCEEVGTDTIRSATTLTCDSDCVRRSMRSAAFKKNGTYVRMDSVSKEGSAEFTSITIFQCPSK